MCESQVVIEGKPDVIEDVVRVIVGKGNVTCHKMLGGKTTIEGRIKEIDLLKHRIILEQ